MGVASSGNLFGSREQLTLMWAVSFNLRKVCVGRLYALKMLGRLGQYNCQQHDDYKQERNNEKSIRLGAVSSALKVDNCRSTTSLPHRIKPCWQRAVAPSHLIARVVATVPKALWLSTSAFGGRADNICSQGGFRLLTQSGHCGGRI